MGIRFLCPNGHKLNVKTFLAGKRGICPQCDAKFLVPAVSGGQAPALNAEPNRDLATESESVLPKPAVPAPPTGMLLADGPPPGIAKPAPPEVWYVRTAAGEQFGPASIGVINGWVAEGRVAVDCWVWRTGWPEWKTGGEAITVLNGPPPEATPPEIGRPLSPASPIGEVHSEPPAGQLPEPTSATAKYRSSKWSRQRRARRATFFLGSIVLLLIAVLIGVLIKNK